MVRAIGEEVKNEFAYYGVEWSDDPAEELKNWDTSVELITSSGVAPFQDIVFIWEKKDEGDSHSYPNAFYACFTLDSNFWDEWGDDNQRRDRLSWPEPEATKSVLTLAAIKFKEGSRVTKPDPRKSWWDKIYIDTSANALSLEKERGYQYVYINISLESIPNKRSLIEVTRKFLEDAKRSL